MLWISIGENCLADHILNRYGLKSFSTQFSSCRSNIDYLIAMEKNYYVDMLDKNFLKYEISKAGAQVIIHQNYMKCDNIFAHKIGFEFTHHDVIGNEAHREAYQRRITRLLRLRRSGEKLFFFYHYRLNIPHDLDTVMDKLNQFALFYRPKNRLCKVVVFTQAIVNSIEERRLEQLPHKGCVYPFRLHTRDIWSGMDPNILWAINDDDLIQQMFLAINTIDSNNLAP